MITKLSFDIDKTPFTTVSALDSSLPPLEQQVYI